MHDDADNLRPSYDYIIAGGGASGLSLAWQMLQTKLAQKRVLIVDASLKPRHDKTWCFWQSTSPPFSDIIHKKWDQLEIGFHSDLFTKQIDKYTYYCIQSDQFQQKIINAIAEAPTFDMLEASITGLESSEKHATLLTKDGKIQADYIFQSCFTPQKIKETPVDYPLIQHFLGWEIQTQQPCFDDTTFTLMDFDDTFDDGIAFMYALPWSEKEMLVEYTVFSSNLLPQGEYEEKINLYLHNRFGIQQIDYQVRRKEIGKIPMQDRPDCRWYKPRILNLGIHGGMTKPSTGYTFRRIQQQVKTITKQLMSGQTPEGPPFSKKRYKAYDLWLLHLISRYPKQALEVFYDLFTQNTMDDVFHFLGEDSSFKQDLHIMRSVPPLPFLKAIIRTSGRLKDLL